MNDNATQVFMALILSGIILIPDIYVGKKLWPQFESRNYPSATGRITHNEITHWTTRKGHIVYEAVIHYHYEVNGQPFEGARLRYSLLSGRRGGDANFGRVPNGFSYAGLF